MKNLIAIFTLIIFAGCASDYNYPKPEARDLCISQDLEIYPNYIMKKGTHTLKKSINKKNLYTTNNLTGTVSSVHSVSVVRLNENISTVCMVEFTHELCADVTGLTYCD